jgi:hypothetical protein
LLLAALTPGAAGAQTLSVRPGLWEHQIQLHSESGRVELALELARTQMALLPPGQRRAIEGVIAAQGLQVDWVNQRFQNCVTEAEAASNDFRFAQAGGCTIGNIQTQGNISHVEFTCAQGQGSLDLIDGQEYIGQSTMTLNLGGFVEQASAIHSGRWLGPSCGAVGQ